MFIEAGKNLKDLNTFMVPSRAKYFAEFSDKDELFEILKSSEFSQNLDTFLVLGGGSNILFKSDFEGFILKNNIKGINVIAEDEESVTVKVGAGENWNNFVMWSVEKGLWGLENLVYIPGTVGASPVQNIGAYGTEVSDLIQFVDSVRVHNTEHTIFFKNECEFSYRDSFFKKNKDFIITHVAFKLLKDSRPKISYGKISELLEQKNIKNPSSFDMANIVKEIRQSKLPEVGELGMAGSFFKNPVVSENLFKELLVKFPEIVFFDVPGGKKIPAGWLLEKAGYKNYQKGNVGNYKKHALIVTHNGKGNGQEVFAHVQDIILKIKNIFNIDLEPEVNII